MFPNQWHEMPQTSNSLEDTPNKITLTHDMNLKAVITLILGLVFQLAQVLPAAAVTAPCASQAVSCECCAGADSCPCMANDESAPKPAPLLPASGNDLKSPLAKSGETRVSLEALEIPVSPAALEGCPVERSWAGYAGVRLSVAFCSFVI